MTKVFVKRTILFLQDKALINQSARAGFLITVLAQAGLESGLSGQICCSSSDHWRFSAL